MWTVKPGVVRVKQTQRGVTTDILRFHCQNLTNVNFCFFTKSRLYLCYNKQFISELKPCMCDQCECSGTTCTTTCMADDWCGCLSNYFSILYLIQTIQTCQLKAIADYIWESLGWFSCERQHQEFALFLLCLTKPNIQCKKRVHVCVFYCCALA